MIGAARGAGIIDPTDSSAPDPTLGKPEVRLPTDIRSAALTMVAFFAAVWLLREAQAFFIPVILAILGAYALGPLVRAQARLRVPRVLASGIAVLAAFSLLALGVYSLSDEAITAVQQLPKAAEKLKRDLRSMRSQQTPVADLQEAARQLQAAATEATGAKATTPGVSRVQVIDPPFNVQQYLLWGSMTVAGFLGQLLMMGFLMFFLLAASDDLKAKSLNAATRRHVVRAILDDVNMRVEQFVRNVVIANVFVGGASWAFFYYMGLENAALLGILCGVVNAVPYVGAAGGVIVVTLATFVQFGSLATAALVGLGEMAITGIEGFVLTPWLMRRTASINGPSLFIGLLFWGWLWGAWGMLLAYPMMMVIKTIVDHVTDFHVASELLSE